MKMNPGPNIALQVGSSAVPKCWITFSRKRALFRCSLAHNQWSLCVLGLECSLKKSMQDSPFSCIPDEGFYFPERSDGAHGKPHRRKDWMDDVSGASSSHESNPKSEPDKVSASSARDATQAELNSKPIAISTSDYHSLVLRQDGTVVAWGNNEFDQACVPANLYDVTAIAAGAYHSLALRNDGMLVAWGSNTYGQLSIPTNLGKVQAIAAGKAHSLALRPDGSVAAWGGIFTTQKNSTPALRDVIKIAAGGFHNLALLSNGTVFSWGNKTYRQTAIPNDLTNIVAIAAGTNHSLALSSQGKLFAWGNNTYGQSNIPDQLNNVVAIAAGAYHNLALCGDGTIVAWGYNAFGQTTIPSNVRNVVAISAGSYHSMVLCSDGTIYAWGLDTDEQVTIPAAVYLPIKKDIRVNKRKVYTLTYKTGENGTLVGMTSQTVPYGESGTIVKAIPNVNYHFANWSDGSTANPRIDNNVTMSRIITANFLLNHDKSDFRSTSLAAENGENDIMKLSINFTGAVISFHGKNFGIEKK